MGENVKPIIECTLRRNMNQEQFPEARNKKTNKHILPNEKNWSYNTYQTCVFV